MPRLCSGEDSHRQADKNVRLRRMLPIFFAKTRMGWTSKLPPAGPWPDRCGACGEASMLKSPGSREVSICGGRPERHRYGLSCRGTTSSNPSPSSEESATKDAHPARSARLLQLLVARHGASPFFALAAAAQRQMGAALVVHGQPLAVHCIWFRRPRARLQKPSHLLDLGVPPAHSGQVCR